ncbi:response regulator transcription factor [Cellulomonas sp. JZ18]|uniref:response regulator n=1 Tax=Cellulomonas sp. JZ18 TaxID=2654191 RepID=UPI001E5A0A48|nr:response regulator transcription factor [Cellulomonas sp. JZ18]
MAPIRVVVGDDETLIRRALIAFLHDVDDMEVVGEAADGEAAVHRCISLRPDVVLMDVKLPVKDGVHATRDIVEQRPGTRVLALSTYSAGRSLVPVLRAGASGFLVKDTEPEDLFVAIRTVHGGGHAFSPCAASSLVAAVRSLDAAVCPEPLQEDEQLSERELAVLQLLAQGMSNAEIARHLHVGETTVKSHLGHVMRKWGARDRVQVLIRAVRAALVRLG